MERECSAVTGSSVGLEPQSFIKLLNVSSLSTKTGS